MKKIFAFLAIATMFAVACQKPANDQKPDGDQKPADEYAGPTEGTSDWALIGQLLGSNWDKDFVLAASGDNFVIKNVKLAATDEFKIRKYKESDPWSINRGGAFGELGKGFAVENNGANIKPGLDGFYDIWYSPAKEQMAVCAKDGAPTWSDGGQQGGSSAIVIDGEFGDWVALAAGTFKRSVNDPDSPWPGVAEMRCYADPDYVFYYVKFDEESLEEAFAAPTPDMHLRLCINTDGEFESGYTNYFLDAYDFIIEGQFVSNGALIDFSMGEFDQRIAGWVTISSDGEGLVEGKGAGLEYEIALNRAEFNKRLNECDDIEEKFPMGDEFQTGMRFYCNGWDEFSNIPNSSTEEEQGNGWGYLIRMTTNK